MSRAPVLLLALLALPAGATVVYRCDLPTGRVEYRDTPCKAGAQSVVDDTDERHALPLAFELQRAQALAAYVPSSPPAPSPTVVLVPVERTLVLERGEAWPSYWGGFRQGRHEFHRQAKPAPPSYIDPAALRRPRR